MAARSKLEQSDPSLSLALAMVCASATPLLLLDGDCRVVASSASFCATFQIDPAEAMGQSLFKLGGGQWEVPQLRSLMSATISGDATIDAYEAELRTGDGPPRCIVLNVRKLVYGDEENIRLLVAVADITAARAMEKAGRALAHDNAVLAQEVRHRVANSLQIIASVMMLNARKASSEEVRGHLRDARNRVMSIADLQRQLAVDTGEVANIRNYLTRLCETIGASMIADPGEIVLSVAAPDQMVDAEVSVSLGLVVTELVINSLKHGLPEGAGGEIKGGLRGRRRALDALGVRRWRGDAQGPAAGHGRAWLQHRPGPGPPASRPRRRRATEPGNPGVHSPQRGRPGRHRHRPWRAAGRRLAGGSAPARRWREFPVAHASR